MSLPASPAARHLLVEILGVLVPCLFVANFTSGIATLQTIQFLRSSSKNVLKAVITTLWSFLLVQAAADIYTVYYYAVINYGDVHAAKFFPPTIAVALVMDALVALSVQIYYSFIVYRFSSSMYIPATCSLLALLNAGLLMYVAVVEVSSSNPLLVYENTKWAAYLSYILRCIIDFILAGTLCLYLTARTSSDVNTTTKTIVNTVMVYAIESELLNWSITIATLVTYITLPTSFVWLGFTFFLARVSFCSLMSLLNARSRFQRMHDETNGQLLVKATETNHGISLTAADIKEINSPTGDVSWMRVDPFANHATEEQPEELSSTAAENC